MRTRRKRPNSMEKPRIELCDEKECQALEAFLVDRIYEFNARETGYFDGRLLGGRLRDATGKVVAGFNGHTWGGCCVVAHLWVHEFLRAAGLGKALLRCVEEEAERRGCRQIVLSTHDFQAPAFYERLGYEKRAAIHDWPAGFSGILYTKRIRQNAAE